jgi:hypothetical protein
MKLGKSICFIFAGNITNIGGRMLILVRSCEFIPILLIDINNKTRRLTDNGTLEISNAINRNKIFYK